MKLMFTIAGVLLALCACGGSQYGSLVMREPTGIQVSAEGEAEGRPDRARFAVGVEVRRPTVAEARDAGATVQTRVIEALRGHGLGDADIQTSQLTVQPEYQYTEAGQQLLGYSYRNSVNIRVARVENVSEIVDAAIAAGGNDVRLDSVRFESSDPQALLNRARDMAMQRARSSAEQLAHSAGVSLGEVLDIDESTSGGAPHPVMFRVANAEAAQSPVEAGVNTVHVQLRVRFAIR